MDAESGELITIDTSNSWFKENYVKNDLSKKSELENWLKKTKVDYFEVYTHDSVMTPLIQYMRKREGRIR